MSHLFARLRLAFSAGDFDLCAVKHFRQQLPGEAFDAFVKVYRKVQEFLVGFGRDPNPDAFQSHVVPLSTFRHVQKDTCGRHLSNRRLTRVRYNGNTWASSITLLIGEIPVGGFEVHG